jgi:hypothetical protein
MRYKYGDTQSESDAIVEDIASGSAGCRIFQKARDLALRTGHAFIVFAGEILPANAEYYTSDLNDAKRYARESVDFWRLCGKWNRPVRIRSLKVPR